MKSKLLLLFLIVLFTLSIISKGQSLDHLVDIGMVDNSASYESFKKLDPYFEDKSIILLGEQSHREGTH